MLSRRAFLGGLTVSQLDFGRTAETLARLAARGQDPRSPQQVAEDEAVWADVARAFTVDRSVVNLNNGGVSPSPAYVQAAMERHLDFSNQCPPPVALWRILEPQKEGVRQRLARQFDCDAEEIALTRNASEGLQICQLGFDLQRGDVVLTSDQDYPRMLTTFRQRARREGIVLETFPLPTPIDDPGACVSRFAERMDATRPKLVLVSHVTFTTGAVLPVAEIVAAGRERGIPVIVDGAHAFAHFAFTRPELDCDYYATSLHKWLSAPHGTGMLFVRKERIGGLWPMMAADEKQDDDIRKFEEIGTHPAANALAVAEALTFHQGIGAERKQERLAFLREWWCQRLVDRYPDRVRLHTTRRKGGAYAIANVAVEGIEPAKLAAWLWHDRRILVTSIGHADCPGIRVSPSVYTTLEELERFVEAMRQVVEHGLPV